jgi:predicted tellurium resistance membrane protein TerC
VEIMDALLAADVWIAFLTLFVLEIVLGMDK